jgi:hypothetical protein
VAGQWILKFLLEPIHEQRKIIGEIAHAITYYENVSTFEGSSTRDRVPEASATLRRLATSLDASPYLIPKYEFMSSRGWGPKFEDISIASRNLILLSNSVYGDTHFNKNEPANQIRNKPRHDLLDTCLHHRWQTTYAGGPEGTELALGAKRGLSCRATSAAGWSPLRTGSSSASGSHELQRRLIPLQARLGRLLRRGQATTDRKSAALCRELTKWWAALWTFARVAGVEPTNNGAEWALRPAVLWRKGSFGSDSEVGSRFAERLLTVVASCRQQGRPLLDFLVAASEAALDDGPSPSLLPVLQGG